MLNDKLAEDYVYFKQLMIVEYRDHKGIGGISKQVWRG
jgi:hypothetical protein